MSADLVAFLRARLDDDERAALAASQEVGIAEWVGSDESGHAWRYWHGGVWGDHDGVCSEAPEVAATDHKGIQRHIARHDPARVRAEVEAKRRIITCVFEYAATIDDQTACCHTPDEIEAGLCPEWQPNTIEALRLLALPYADHHDYRDEWRL